MIIDCQVKVGESLYGNGAKVDDLLIQMREVGIDRALMCPVKPRGYHLNAANDCVSRAVREHPGRLMGFTRVDPHLSDAAMAEFRRGVEELGLCGLYLHPWEECFAANEAILDPFLQYAQDRSLPVMIETGYPWVSHPSQVADLARRFPQVMLIATNAAMLDLSGFTLSDTTAMLKRSPNVHLLTSTAVSVDFLRELETETAQGRVLFGSGFPQFDLRLELLRVNLLPVDQAVRERILSQNAARVLRLPG